MNALPPTPHDRFFRGAFSQPAVAAGFFRAYLPAELLQSLRMDSLSLCKDTFIEKELRDFRSDLLYQANWQGEQQGWLYLLLEHKSSPERWTGLQLQNYLHQIWTLHLKQAQDNKKTRFLPSIVPLVLYHGAAAWTPPRQFKDLLQLQDSALAPYQLQFEYLLCNLSDLSARELRAGLASRLVMRALHNIFAENSQQGLRHTLELLAEISD
ncbi:MAG: Rpn family recombination-promoting nuclease/putative transposase, partial [Gammaproteobacteria bacterium]|nr:Rpn family recombination-promoting nuclease/putative transposase [Gammaproteobacteria bacterium]